MDSAAKSDTATNASEGEKEDQAEFMVKAASGGMMEVVLGKMAEKQASSADVKAFGKMMVTDHTKANEEMKKLAATKNITLPVATGKEHQEHIDKLSKLKGAEFDKEYMNLMVDDHEEDIEHFKEAANADGYDADVKALASKTVPVLEKHLEHARTTNDKVKNAK
jgi:putative membrane protein